MRETKTGLAEQNNRQQREQRFLSFLQNIIFVGIESLTGDWHVAPSAGQNNIFVTILYRIVSLKFPILQKHFRQVNAILNLS